MQAEGDRMLLRALLENLIGNAWKYSARRPEALIDVSCSGEGQEAVYCVTDNGEGFDMRFADRLFGVFQRLHSAADFPGTGVGLATVQRIARRHGGRVWAESEAGCGSRFYFTLWDKPGR
jgi:light-regulated signal transduction histidine kinase (bacteriophytochrome)